MEQLKVLPIYQEKTSKLKYNYLIFALLSFFMGQAEIFPGFYTFFPVYWSIFLNTNPYLVTLVSTGGIFGLLYAGGWDNLYYVSGVAGLIMYMLYQRFFRKSEIIQAFFIAFSYMLSSVVFNYYHNSQLYLYLLRIAESGVIFLFIIVARQGSQKLTWKKKKLTYLEIMLILFLSSGIIISIFEMTGSGIVVNSLVLLLIFTGANSAGPYMGLMLAAIYGLVLMSTGIIPMLTVMKYMIFGLISGLLSRKRKLWHLIPLALAFFLYSGFSASIYDLRESLLETLLVGFIYLILPLSVWDNLYIKFTKKNSLKVQNTVLDDKYRDLFNKQISELAAVFLELSSAFKEVLPGRSQEKTNRLEDFVFLFKNKNCTSCYQRKQCWQKNREQTYRTMKTLLLAAKSEGKLTKEIIDKKLGDFCINSSRITGGAKSCFEIFQVNNFWRNRFIDRQEIVSEQLNGISQIIDEFSDKTGISFVLDFSQENLWDKVKKHKIDVSDIKIYNNLKNDKVNIKVMMEPCADSKPCEHELIGILNSEYNYNFRILKWECGNKLKDKPCTIHYGPTGPYHIEMAVVQLPAVNNISGDSYQYRQLTDGLDMLVLSDGMGVGKDAARESKTAVKLFNNIIEAGFDRRLAIKTINSALFLRNQDERFTTLDIAFFNTFTGQLKLEKIGAMSTFIKRNWDIMKYKSSSLPVGILDNIEVTSHSVQLEDNDFVFMLTDGILDSSPEVDDKEGWFSRLLQNISFNTAQGYIEYIIEVINGNNKEIDDDITLLVFKVDKEF